MHKFTALSAAIAISATLSGNAQAGANRTFVSGHGSDSNPCSLAAPCRSFAQALSQTNPGGEIGVLDTAGYGAVTIQHSVTITNPGGVEAGITAGAGANAITIAAGTGDVVTLRGLTIEGAGVGLNGIALTSSVPRGITTIGGTLNIIDCVIKDFAGNGITIEPTVTGVGTAPTLNVTNNNVSTLNNGGNGINIASTTALVLGFIYNATSTGNSVGYRFSGAQVGALLGNSHADANSANGIANLGAFLTVKNSTALYNNSSTANSDILVNQNGTALLYNNNTIGGINNSAAIYSDGTNNVGSLTGNAIQRLGPL